MAKIIRLEDAPKVFFPDGRAYRALLLPENGEAKRIGGLLGVIPAGSEGVKYHYHDERESALFILEGSATAIVENKEYFLEKNMILYVPPKERHRIANRGDSELRYIEFFTNPPLSSDFKEVAH